MYAKEDFQLLESRTGDVRIELPWRKNTPYMNPRVRFSEESNGGGDTSQHITAVIGKNGTGKSHLLTSIVQTFVSLEELQIGKRTSVANLALEFLAYRIDGRHCTVERKPHRRLELKVDGQDTDIFDFPLPKRVVALTISPFDKFPVPRLLRNSVAPADTSLYQYLGLRDRFYKASIDNLLFRSLNTLFEEEQKDDRRRANIGSVFDFLKLLPTLTVVYRIKIASELRNMLYHGKSLVSSGILTNNDQRLRVEEMLKGGFDENYLHDLLELALLRGEKGIIRTTADFSNGGEVDETFKILQPLRRAGFLKIAGVEVTQANGLVSDLKRASSGQLSMISSLLSLASVITDGSLVLIDEPELSLHPEWQTDYVGLLMQAFSQFSGCHFIIATHSPLVISELPKGANIIALDKSRLPPLNDIAGQSSDYLLAEVFGSPLPGNLYIRERVVRALRLAGNGDVHSDEFKRTLSDLRRLSVELGDTDPARKLIEDLSNVAASAGTEAKN
ncbi:AAA family ATPase [Neorhizobium sp. DAR64861/K0K2]|uniref:AAA family ATPase n=1 Tax=unclassified Neorhizobium TaxID=2629175 RepID=UPI003D2B3542